MTSRRWAAGTLNPWRPNPRRPASYDLKAADRKRNLAIQIGLTSIVVIFAVALVLYIVMTSDKKPAVRRGQIDPGRVEQRHQEGGQLRPEGRAVALRGLPVPALRPVRAAVRADGQQAHRHRRRRRRLLHGRHPGSSAEPELLVARGRRGLLRGRRKQGCVPPLPRRALRAAALGDRGGVFPDNARLVEVARQAGAGGGVPDCIDKGRYTEMVQGLAAATGIQSTPTIRINGEDYAPTTPDALVAKIKETVGNVPGLDGAAPPAPPAPAPATAPRHPRHDRRRAQRRPAERTHG